MSTLHASPLTHEPSLSPPSLAPPLTPAAPPDAPLSALLASPAGTLLQTVTHSCDTPGPGCPSSLSPLWAMLLVGDGSPTMQLGALTGAPIRVRLLEVVQPGGEGDVVDAQLLPAVDAIPPPRVRRRVLLQCGNSGTPLAYAVSWWNVGDYAAFLGGDEQRPIGTSLATAGLEVHRELHCGVGGTPPPRWGVRGVAAGSELWGRWYTFHHGGRPLAVIGEVFSPTLREWLGSTGSE